MRRKRIYSALLTVVMSFSVLIGNVTIEKPIVTNAATTGTELATAANSYNLENEIQDGVTLQCWNWSYNNIKNNMKTIAEQGFSAIQTSPIQLCKESTIGKAQGSNWWLYYQPAAFYIDNSGTNALGTKAEFEAMCETAHQYGVKVVVDVVANHLGNTKGNDLSPTIPDDIEYDSSCWHDIGTDISNYSSRYNITQYCMSGLPDLNTSNTKIQQYVLNYLKECIDAGADGFRFDAAKHIETPDDSKSGCSSQFWPTVINGAKSYAASARGIDLYCYGEVLDSPDSAGTLAITSYTKYMSVTDNESSNDTRSNVNSGNAAGASSSYYHKGAAGADKLVLWAESHDTYTANTSSGVSTDNINKTWAIVGARADAMALYFARPYSYNTTLGNADKTGWSYEQVAAVNKFHNTFTGTTEYCASAGNIAYVERGTSGVILVNCSGTNTSVNVAAHKIAAGTYKDQITGNTFTVANGMISGTIGNTGIAVVYNPENIEPENPTDPEDPVEEKNTAYLKLPEGWSTPIYCYAYDSATEKVNNGNWPGEQMTEVSAGIYQYEVPDNIQAPRVIFYSSSSNRYPSDMEKGLLLSGSMIYADGNWSAYQAVSTGTVTVKYVDAEGNILADAVTISGTVGTTYATAAKNISGYTLANAPENAAGTYTDVAITVTYVYEKDEIVDPENPVTTSNVAYLYKPDGWGSTLNCYVYSGDNESNRNAAWPGVAMTQVADDLYRYEVSDDISDPLVIFNDGSNQYPAANQVGLALSGAMVYENGNWSSYEEEADPEDPVETSNVAYISKPDGWGSTLYCYVYSSEDASNRNAAWPGIAMTQVSGTIYSYQVSDSITDPLVIFTDGSNQYPAANQAGLSISGAMIYQNGSWGIYTQ